MHFSTLYESTDSHLMKHLAKRANEDILGVGD